MPFARARERTKTCLLKAHPQCVHAFIRRFSKHVRSFSDLPQIARSVTRIPFGHLPSNCSSRKFGNPVLVSVSPIWPLGHRTCEISGVLNLPDFSDGSRSSELNLCPGTHFLLSTLGTADCTLTMSCRSGGQSVVFSTRTRRGATHAFSGRLSKYVNIDGLASAFFSCR